jgi:hypothetical protein
MKERVLPLLVVERILPLTTWAPGLPLERSSKPAPSPSLQSGRRER